MSEEAIQRMRERRESWRQERDEARKRLMGSISDQFAAIGSFVQEFELMVAEARGACFDLLSTEQTSTLVRIALHHQALTARPIIEIFRAMYAHIASDKSIDLSDEDREVILGVISQINKDYTELVEIRNNLLHGTWTIGHTEPDEDGTYTTLRVHKFKATSKGLEYAKVPKDVKMLAELTKKCADVGYDIAMLNGSYLFRRPPELTQVFKKDGTRWLPDPPRADA